MAADQVVDEFIAQAPLRESSADLPAPQACRVAHHQAAPTETAKANNRCDRRWRSPADVSMFQHDDRINRGLCLSGSAAERPRKPHHDCNIARTVTAQSWSDPHIRGWNPPTVLPRLNRIGKTVKYFRFHGVIISRHCPPQPDPNISNWLLMLCVYRIKRGRNNPGSSRITGIIMVERALISGRTPRRHSASRS